MSLHSQNSLQITSAGLSTCFLSSALPSCNIYGRLLTA